MDHQNLHQLDLNLLLVMDALLQTESVTGASKRLGVTQSAASHALNRLRALFDDPLFIRDGRRMLPTARAASMAGPLRSSLQALLSAVQQPAEFDPAESDRAFVIATSDLFDATILPALARAVHTAGPRLRITTRPAIEVSVSALEKGDVHIVIAPAIEIEGPLLRRKLYHDSFVVVARKDHPSLGALPTIDLATYLGCTHALHSPKGEGPSFVDTLLAQTGQERHVGLRIAHFASAPYVIAGTDLVLTAPRSLANLISDDLNLRVWEHPLALGGFTTYAWWHERFSSDPGVRWMLEMIFEVASSLPQTQ